MSTFDEMEKPPLDELMHFGVKGMRWGVHKHPSSGTNGSVEARVRTLNKRAARLNSDRVISGLGYTANAYRKQQTKALKKDPNFDFKKLSLAEQRAYLRKAPRKTSAQIALLGALETTALLAGGNYVLNRMVASKTYTRPETTQGARMALLVLAGKNAHVRINQLRDVRTASKYNVINNERDLLDPKQKLRG